METGLTGAKFDAGVRPELSRIDLDQSFMPRRQTGDRYPSRRLADGCVDRQQLQDQRTDDPGEEVSPTAADRNAPFSKRTDHECLIRRELDLNDGRATTGRAAAG